MLPVAELVPDGIERGKESVRSGIGIRNAVAAKQFGLRGALLRPA
jgi:hypothetical protein